MKLNRGLAIAGEFAEKFISFDPPRSYLSGVRAIGSA
jgi:hypothetical protein